VETGYQRRKVTFFVEHAGSYLQEEMCSTLAPFHLLFLTIRPIGFPIFLELIVPLRSLKLSDKMIKNFGDHSANERTFLAWVRTAIAVMAFGFLVEKFDLFLEFAAPSLAGRTLSLPGQKFGNMAGLALIVLGTAMVGIAAARFVRIAKNIDREDVRPGTGSRIDIALAGLLVLLGCALFLYLSHALVTNL